jgi:hypothetical protein
MQCAIDNRNLTVTPPNTVGTFLLDKIKNDLFSHPLAASILAPNYQPFVNFGHCSSGSGIQPG